MSVFLLLVVLVPLVALLVIVAIVLVLALAVRKRLVRPGAVPPPAPAARGWSGVWNVELLGAGPLGALGGTLASTFGTFRLEGGELSFTPDGQQAPAWQVPCDQLGVRRRDLISLDGADLELEGPMGRLRCNVSTEHINRFTQNTFKDLRERGYAAQFAAVLRGNGARVDP